MLICGQGLDIVQKFSASQIIKQDGILPKNPSKKDAIEKLKVRKKLTQSFTDFSPHVVKNKFPMSHESRVAWSDKWVILPTPFSW